jgi:hypothetical protein
MRKELEGHLKIGGSSQLRFKVLRVSKCIATTMGQRAIT